MLSRMRRSDAEKSGMSLLLYHNAWSIAALVSCPAVDPIRLMLISGFVDSESKFSRLL